MNDRFNKICKKDVIDIFEEIDPYINGYNLKDLNQSVVYDQYKTVIFKGIRNDSNEIIGKEIYIELPDIDLKYILQAYDNILRLEKSYSNIKEEVQITLEGNDLTRSFVYTKDDIVSNYEENYNLKSDKDFYSYVKSLSIEENFKILKTNNKVRKRN